MTPLPVVIVTGTVKLITMSMWKVWLGVTLVGLGPSLGDRPYFNDQKVPEKLADLLAIQQNLQENLVDARAATVCLEMAEGGSGSGVIVSEDGLVLTAAHVTGGVDRDITVIMEDGTKYQGVSLGLESSTDAAMLQIVGEEPFPFVEVDKSDSFRLGDWVFSLGHSGGFDKDRGVNVRVGRLTRQADSTIQSGCMLIGGDSGGPLFDINGRLIGIHSRVGASKEESMHVPLREFQRNWDEMLDSKFLSEGGFARKGEPGTGFLGLVIEKSDEGPLRVAQIYPESPAEEGELKVGDVITSFTARSLEVELKGDDLHEPSKIYDVLDQLGPGEAIRLSWSREGKEFHQKIILGERP